MTEVANQLFAELDRSTQRDSKILDTSTGVGARRYTRSVRIIAGTFVGIVASVLIISSMQVGAAYALDQNARATWGALLWGQHWAWRAAWGLVATFCAAFLGGLASRDHGRLVGTLGALPSAGFWAVVSYLGWVGHFPDGSTIDIPIGYRLAGTIVALATLPVAAVAGESGAGYGSANGAHYDATRATLFGIRWYHYLWLPFLIHFLILEATWAGIYGFEWFVAAMRDGFSFFISIPALFMMAMWGTLLFMATGAFRAYEALAGFESDDKRSVAKRVLTYGVGYQLLAALAQSAISFVHYGLARLFS